MRQLRAHGRPPRPRRAAVAFAAVCASWTLASLAAEPLDVDATIAALARTAPASIAFAEARFSTLLREPIVSSGELRYAAPQRLDRIVTEPHAERTSIDGDTVTVARDAEPAKSFGLRRAPELRALLAGLGALLAGDSAAVRHEFDVAAAGSAEGWSLELTPRDSSVARRVAALVAIGAGPDLRCFEIRDSRGGATLTLLGAASVGGIPPDATLDALLDRCRAE